jgi:hypothetical protein
MSTNPFPPAVDPSESERNSQLAEATKAARRSVEAARANIALVPAAPAAAAPAQPALSVAPTITPAPAPAAATVVAQGLSAEDLERVLRTVLAASSDASELTAQTKAFGELLNTLKSETEARTELKMTELDVWRRLTQAIEGLTAAQRPQSEPKAAQGLTVLYVDEKTGETTPAVIVKVLDDGTCDLALYKADIEGVSFGRKGGSWMWSSRT